MAHELKSPFHMDLKFKVRKPFHHDRFRYDVGDWFPKDVEGNYDVAAKRRIAPRLFRQMHDQWRIESVEPEEPNWSHAQHTDEPIGLDPAAVAALATHTALTAKPEGEVAPAAEGAVARALATDEAEIETAIETETADQAAGALHDAELTGDPALTAEAKAVVDGIADKAEVVAGPPVKVEYKGFGKYQLVDKDGLKADPNLYKGKEVAQAALAKAMKG